MTRRGLALGAILTSLVSGQDVFTGVKRIVAVGDIHGGYDEVNTILRAAGVMDAAGKWIGGDTHLVQVGDILDRGADSRKVLDRLQALEGQARRARGRVHLLLGNHEAMNMYGDLRYTSAGEYAAFVTSDSAGLQARAYESLADPAHKDDPAYRSAWEKEHPPGWVEHRQAFAASGRYGKLFVQRNGALKINDTLFLHGGISPKYAALTIADINTRTRAELKDFRLLPDGIVMDPQGPYWYRGLASDAEDSLAAHVESLLKTHQVSRIVIGHTPTAGAIVPRFGGRVVLADVGLSRGYNHAPVCLLIEDGKAIALHRGIRLALPPDAAGVAAYLKASAALDPPDSNLRKFVQSGQR